MPVIAVRSLCSCGFLLEIKRQQSGTVGFGKIAAHRLAASGKRSFEDSRQVILRVLLVQNEIAKGIDLPGQPQCFPDTCIVFSTGKTRALNGKLQIDRNAGPDRSGEVLSKVRTCALATGRHVHKIEIVVPDQHSERHPRLAAAKLHGREGERLEKERLLMR